MKRKNFKTRVVSLVVFLLVGVMGVTGAISSFLGNTASGSNISTNSAIQATQSDKDVSSLLNSDVVEASKLREDDRIGMIIEMSTTTLIDIYNANPSGYESFTDYRLSTEGKAAAENLKNKQNAVFNKIARQADVELKYNYVNASNAFAIELTYGDWKLVESIAYKANVANVTVSERYLAPEATIVENSVGAQSTGIFDSAAAIEDGIAGQGQVVAVLDTGLDWEHVAFDPNHEKFALEEQKANGTLRIGRDDVAAVLDELSAANITANLAVDELYRNEKVPFGYDYADSDIEISSHVANNHGTHVAGILAGHSDDPFDDKNENGIFDRELTGEDDEHYYDEKGEVITGITGVAPQAQLAIFKVFPDIDGGAEDYAMLGAIEDAITLGVDVINMSLGGDCGFQDETNGKDSIFHVYEALQDVGISLVVAAGNSTSSSFTSHYGLNLTSNPDSGIVSAPGSFDASFTVASISGKKSPYLLAVNEAGQELGAAYFLDSTDMGGDPFDFLEEIYLEVEERGLTNQFLDTQTGALKIPYVSISGVGSSSNYAGKNVKDKIALVSRGEINFEDKVNEAALHGAVAIVVYNNASGVIRMSVGDNPQIPSCSIMMDAAASIKNQDALGNAYFVIDEDNEAGPFISEFSSLGALPNLVLKPDITAHGGEIYSAIPGDEKAYARASGTSMACPNTAGVVALLRQHFSQPSVAAKYGIDLNNDGKVSGFDELNMLEQRIYQILQSTATIALNEDANPYSPRKQGAGLADLETSRHSEQYLYVMDENGNEKERTKIELFDDPEMLGEYELEFYVRNVGATSQSYNISAFVMTEGISSDGKTVSERAYMLEATNRTLKVNDVDASLTDAIVVPANGSVKITYTVSLTDADRAWLAKFENGMYVEGFVCLTNSNDSQESPNLNIPYLAFYGDWSQAPIFDYDLYETSKDANDDNIDDDDKRYANTRPTMLVGKIVENNTEYSLPMGMFPFLIPEEYEAITPDTLEDYCALSYDNSTGMFGLFCVAGFLRSAKKLFWQITDTMTGDVIMEDVYYCARKASAAGSYGGAWVELDLGVNLDLVNNRQYNMAIYPVLDWNAEEFNSIQDVIDYNEAYNAANPGKERRYCWDSNFWVDTDSPYISDVEVRIERDRNDNANYYIDFYLTDNHYISSFGFDYYDVDERDFVTYYSDNGMRPVLSERNSTTLITFEITHLWDQISDGIEYRNTMSASAIANNPELSTYLTQFQVQVFDYAFNTAYYDIDIYELMEGLTSVSFGDIGNYSEYTSKTDATDRIKVLTSTNDNISTDVNGNPITLRSFTMVSGQRVELMKSVVATPATAWREDFEFSVSGVSDDILRVDNETGELYALPGLESQTDVYANVIIRSRTNSGVSASIQVRILTEAQAENYGINLKKIQSTKTIESLSFTDVSGKYFNAGEEYIVEVEANPWYIDIDPDKYFIQWTSGSDIIATVRPMLPTEEGYSPLKAVVKANDGYYDDNGEYVKNISASIGISAQLCEYDEYGRYETEDGRKYNTTFYSAQFYAAILQEFVLEGSELTEYNGTPDNGVVIIPDNLNIKTIKDNLFYKRDDITEIRFNEGLETIGYAACAYMPNLEKVVFSSTINAIGAYAFAAYNPTSGEGVESRLTVVDTTACAKPIQVGMLAFAMQKYIGIDLDKSTIVDYGDDLYNRNRFVRYEEGDENYGLFDTTMLRTAAEYAFYGCYFLDNLNLVNLRMTTEGTFYGVGAWIPKYFPGEYASITFGEFTALGMASFAASGIGEVVLPMQRIGMQAFYGTTTVSADGSNASGDYLGELSKITFTSDNLIIEEGAFLYSSVRNIEFKGSVDYIGDAAFAYAQVENITWAEGKDVKNIGAQAFYGTNFSTFELPAGLEKLGNGAFGECDNLVSITIDKDCKISQLGVNDTSSVGTSVFYLSDRIANFYVEPGNQYFTSRDGILYNQDGTELVGVPGNKRINDIDAVLNGVTKLGSFAFASNLSVTAADLSNITDMGIGAFFGCTNLTTVTLSDELVEIPTEAFYECSSLETINLSSNSNLEVIGDFAFYQAKMRTFNLPSGVKEIGAGAFAYCSRLSSFAFTSRVDEIAEDMFYECTSLTNVTFSRFITSIGARAFAYSGITSVNNLNSCTFIGEAAFAACSRLTTVNLSAVRTIEAYAFMAETTGAIRTLEISQVRTIGDYAFYGQTSITSVTANYCESVGGAAFYGCSGLTQAAMSSIKTIGENAFTDSGLYAFNASSQYSAVLPATVENISATAFAGTLIMGYSVNGNGEYFADNEGVLYRNLPAGGYELVSFPSYKQSSMEYTVIDGTVRIGAFAFAFTQYVTKVNIPASVKAIGDCAFYGTSVRIFNFNTLTAPILETSYQSYAGERDTYFWQIYNNFYMPFTYSYEMYGGYKYNPIRLKTEEGELIEIYDDYYNGQGGYRNLQNTAYTAEDLEAGLMGFWYGIMICRPSNAEGFDDFIWSHYFDSEMLLPELIETATIEAMELIESLPAANQITSANKSLIERARNRYNALSSDQQRAFVREAGLVTVLEKAEAALANLSATAQNQADAVVALIAALPSVANITLSDKDAVVAARAAYTALNSAAKNIMDANVIAMDKLAECEAKIAQLESGEGNDNQDGESCGTVAFGGGNGSGTGLMVGLMAALLACLAVVFLSKKKVAQR